MNLLKFTIIAALLLCSIVYAKQGEKPDLNPLKALQYLEKKEQKLETWTKVKARKGSSKFKKKQNEIRKSLDAIMDYNFIAKYILGDHWDKTPDNKRKILLEKIRELLTEFYLEDMFYNKSYEKKYIERGIEELYIKGVKKSIFITTELQVTLKKKPVIYEVIYHMYKSGKSNSYRVFDIELDSVSLIRNYKSQFKKTLKEKDVDALIALIDKKLNKNKTKSKPKQTRKKKK